MMRRPVRHVLRGLGLGVVVLLGGLGMASPADAQCNASQLCAPGADPCVISSACTVPAGSTFDIRPRALVIAAGKPLEVAQGSEPLTIRAGSILLEPGGRILVTGVTGTGGFGGAVVLQATNTFTMQSMGSTNSRIETIGLVSGGTIEISAGGNIDINGLIRANSTSPNGFGGLVDVVSETGTIAFHGAGVQASGGDNGETGASGGAIGVFAPGTVTVNAPLDVAGGDCICDISIESLSGDVNITAAGDLNLRGRGGIGDGGATSISAEGNVNIAGDVFAPASGSGGEFGFGGGFGGDLDVFALGSIVLTGRVDLDGASPDGDGGNVDLQADLDVTVNGVVEVLVGGLGAGGDVFISAGRNLALNSTIDAGADAFGGQIDVTAAETATITGTLDTRAVGLDNVGGTIVVQACTLETTATSLLDSRGNGAFPSATNLLLASNTLTSRGRLLAGSTNRLDYLTTVPTVIPPALPAPVISPAVTLMQNPALPCCVDCAECGDGNVTADEQCDDGNSSGGDCCSATCQFEPINSPCANDGIICTRDVCNGAGACTHPAGNAGAVCRLAAGDCDMADTCDGVSPTCPADAKRTGECRPAASSCDVAESCDGSSNACPPDVVADAGMPCRAAAGMCDVAETCNGISGLCPPDAKSTAQCRAADGECDVAESCDGVNDACPADGFAPSTTVCREAAGDCDVADTCSGSSATCPADTKSTAVCRAATGSCDIAESCDGVADTCPADEKAPDGTTCGSDACTGAGSCEAGVCTGAEPLTCGACQTCDPVEGCVVAPRDSCAAPVQSRKAQFQIKDSPKGEESDKVMWKWVKGAATTAADFGDPVATDDMDLCVFDRSAATPALLYRAHVPAGGTCGTKACWVANGTKGFKYVNKSGAGDGINSLILTAGVDGKAKIIVKGKGVNLTNRPFGLPAPPLALPLTVQLQSGNGKCWEAEYSEVGVAKNTDTDFNGKAD